MLKYEYLALYIALPEKNDFESNIILFTKEAFFIVGYE
jgi:hypothetical protein